MKLLAALTMFLCLAAASDIRGHSILKRKDSLSAGGDKSISERIINGEAARPNQFPYQAGLILFKRELSMWCGGSLISKEWVLTAGHCVDGAENVAVHLGSITYIQSPVKFNLTKKNIVAHSDFSHEPLKNDIALIRIPTVSYTDAIKPIALPKTTVATYVDSIVTASGWGRTSEHAQLGSPILMHTDLKIIANVQCQSFYNDVKIDNTKLCTAHYHGGAICFGDSGGPLVLKSPNVLVGISSFGAGCASSSPDGFTHVFFYLNWIQNQTGLKF